MFKLDYTDHRPVYEQIKENFKNLIITGAMAEGDAMPSVRELAAILGINPNTIQRAYKELETEGFIYSMRAKGSFVAPRTSVIDPKYKEELMLKLNKVLSELAFSGVKKEEICNLIDNLFKEEGK